MSSEISVVEERVVLLESSSLLSVISQRIPLTDDDEITLSSSSDRNHAKPNSSEQNQRLVSLDVFRGLTIALMILVDDAGGAFPSLNHAPWTGVTIADFVMPFFLFGVGVSIALVFKKVSNKQNSTQKVLSRTMKLFFLGLVLQGGYFHGRNHLTYGVDINRIRWFGVLREYLLGTFLAAISEIWLVDYKVVDSLRAFASKYYMQWILAAILSLVYLVFLYGLYVPNWEFEVPNTTYMSESLNQGSKIQLVQCGLRGSLTPPCNAVGLIDRFLLGVGHLYQRPVYRRLKECSVKSPDYGPLPPNSPGWCLAPFDPEGILSSSLAAVTCFIGLHYGHIIVHCKSHSQRIIIWLITSLVLLLVGYTMEALGMPLSKPLYTLSYMLVTAGWSGITFAMIYFLVDVYQWRKPTKLLQWMGMNALIIYALAACELFPAAIQGFYWLLFENNLINAAEALLQNLFHSRRWGTLAFVLLEILLWCLFAGFLHMKGIYIKL